MIIVLAPALALALALALAAALATTGSRLRRRGGLVLGLAALLPAWLLPADAPLLRGLLALVAFSWVMRVADLVRIAEMSAARRVLHVFSVVDSRRLRASPPRPAWGALLRGVGWLALALVASGGLVVHEPGPPLRWGLGLVLVYAAIEALYALLAFAYRALGFATPPLHVLPIASRSVQELWGARWARPISDWLHETFFRPYARRRRPMTGVLLAFGVSAAFHAYCVWVALGLTEGLGMAACTTAYFVLQGMIMGAERAIGVRDWAVLPARVWTVGWMVGASPLFIEPLMRVLVG